MGKKKYKGKLGKKHPPRRIGLLASEAEANTAIQRWIDEDWEKILLLCDEFGVQVGEHMWPNLVRALCQEYVPGFQELPPDTIKWTNLRLGYLVVEMEREMGDGNCSQIAAAESLSRREPWRSFTEARAAGEIPNRAESLRFQYKNFNNDRWGEVARKAFKYHEHMGTLDQWNMELLKAFQSESAPSYDSPTDMGKFLTSPPPKK